MVSAHALVADCILGLLLQLPVLLLGLYRGCTGCTSLCSSARPMIGCSRATAPSRSASTSFRHEVASLRAASPRRPSCAVPRPQCLGIALGGREN